MKLGGIQIREKTRKELFIQTVRDLMRRIKENLELICNGNWNDLKTI